MQSSHSSNLCSRGCRGTLPRELCPIHHQVICRVDAGKAGTGGNGTPLFAALLPAATGSSPILQSLPSPASKKRKASNKQSTEVTAGTCPYQQASQTSNDCSCWLHNLLHAQVDASKTGNGGNGTPLFAALLPAAIGSSPILQSLSMLASINKFINAHCNPCNPPRAGGAREIPTTT